MAYPPRTPPPPSDQFAKSVKHSPPWSMLTVKSQRCQQDGTLPRRAAPGDIWIVSSVTFHMSIFARLSKGSGLQKA